jgi:dienelactone hydrolase
MKDKTFLQLIVPLIFLYPLSGHATGNVRSAHFQSSGRSVTYEVFDGGAQTPLVIILHGASGPDASFYRSQAKYFSQNGHTVLLLHYFDASSSSTPSEANYRKWAKAVVDLIQECANQPSLAGRKVALVGYSLGASVALAVGSSGASVDSIAE